MSVQKIATPNMMNNIKIILSKMNQKSLYSSNKYSFEADVLKGISIGDKAYFLDGRCVLANLPEDKQMQYESRLNIGRTRLIIDNKTGNITDCSKPFFKSWKSVFKDLDKYLNIFAGNFDNNNVVKQHRVKFSGFTKAGFEKLQNLIPKS